MDRIASFLDRIGLTWFVPLVRISQGKERAYQTRVFLKMAGIPLASLAMVLLIWQALAASKGGAEVLPTPGQVWGRGVEQFMEWHAEGARRVAYEAEVAKNVRETGMSDKEVRAAVPYEQKKLFVNQMLLSLQTVFTGVGLAVLVAVPLGILCGLSTTINSAMNPLIQVFKPVSPLAWFPVVYLIANKLVSNDAAVPKSFLVAAIVVSLCAMWPALINTANGVANVDRDHLNVAKVLNLNFFQKVWRIVLPASLPSIFTGIRLSLGIGWMVLIAAEMMAVSPGLGGFVWDWYQSSNEIAMSYLVLAVLVIGIIGFLLDRIMIGIQKFMSHGNAAAIR